MCLKIIPFIDENYVKKIINDQGVDCIFSYISGSVVEGFGNNKSDIDIFIICEKEELLLLSKNTTKQEGERILKNMIYQGRRYDLEFIPHSYIKNLVTTLSQMNFKNEGYLEEITEQDIDFLHRFNSSKCIVHKNVYSAFKKENSKLENNLRLYIGIKNSLELQSMIEDIQGAIEENNLPTAHIMLKRYSELILTTYLALNGQTNTKVKWNWKKISKMDEYTKDKLEDYFMVYDGYKFDKDNFIEHFKTVMKYSQLLNLEIQKKIKILIGEE